MSAGIPVHDLRGVIGVSGSGVREQTQAQRSERSSDRIAHRVRELLESEVPSHGWLKEFELKAARQAEAPHAIAVSSRNAAIHLLLQAIDLQPGDEVIIPAYAPLAVADVIRHFDAHPIPVDISPETLLIDSQAVHDAVSDRTRAIIAVAIAGRCVATDDLIQMSNSQHLPLIIDSSSCLPGILPVPRSDGRVATLFAAQATGSSASTDGVLIATFSDDLSMGVRRRRMQIAPEPHVAWPELPSAGLRYVTAMSEANALWCLAGLGFARDDWRRRCEIAMSYSANVSSMAEVDEPPESGRQSHAWTGYPLRLNLLRLPVSRNDIATSLRNMHVDASVQCVPISLHPHYQELYAFSPETFPVARNEFLREISLPIHADMIDDDVEFVSSTLQHVIQVVGAGVRHQ
ncbi:MAG: DegT/DnrJ/EryC1/StrS family aminotransferase [Planctomycetota bacterium]|jgi:dTDP-4-amino-4,6-dideoxygalactose transaminase